MIGKLRYNLWAGVAGFIFTFLFSIRNNLWLTSFNRAIIAFAAWFLLVYLLRWVITLALAPDDLSAKQHGTDVGPEEQVGVRFDMSTPTQDDEELMNLLKQEPENKPEGGDFVPLNPPKLVSNKNPEELAKAVRHLTEK